MLLLRAALLVSGSYYLAARLGFALTPEWSAISLLWPANALLLASLLLAPPRQWWALIAAVLPAHLAAELQSGVPMSMALGWYLSNCSEALMGAGGLRLFLGRAPRFDSFRDVGALLVFGAMLAPVLSSFIDAALVTALHWGPASFWAVVRMRIPSNALAALIVVPFVLTWAHAARAVLKVPAPQFWEAGVVLGGLAAASLLVFNWLEPGAGARQIPALFYVPLPFLLWAGVRLGSIGVSTANLLLAAAVLWGADHGLGPFVSGSPEENARDAHLFLIAVTVPMLLLAALLAERRRVELEARGQRQQLAHLSRVSLLGGLSGALAHELNQPLTAILSNAQAAERRLAAGQVDLAELGEILKDIVAADRRASEVIARLRALFKNGDSQLQELDVNDVVHEVLELAHGDLATRHVTIVQRIEAQLPKARGDRIQLQQVLLNLVVNACEAMSTDTEGRRERVLKVETRRGAQDGVQISITDSGPGFDASAEALFEPFYTTKPHGLGLGLSISRSIISAHGGRLWGSGMPGKGAAFHVHLLAAPAGGHPTLVQ